MTRKCSNPSCRKRFNATARERMCPTCWLDLPTTVRETALRPLPPLEADAQYLAFLEKQKHEVYKVFAYKPSVPPPDGLKLKGTK